MGETWEDVDGGPNAPAPHNWRERIRTLEAEVARLRRLQEDAEGQLDELQQTKGELLMMRRLNAAAQARVRELEEIVNSGFWICSGEDYDKWREQAKKVLDRS